MAYTILYTNSLHCFCFETSEKNDKSVSEEWIAFLRNLICHRCFWLASKRDWLVKTIRVYCRASLFATKLMQWKSIPELGRISCHSRAFPFHWVCTRFCIKTVCNIRAYRLLLYFRVTIPISRDTKLTSVQMIISMVPTLHLTWGNFFKCF